MRRLAVVATLVMMATGCTAQANRPAASPSTSTSAVRSPGLHVVARIPLPGGNSRFDYASLDPGRGLLFVAHLGASQVVEVNIHTGRIVRTIPGLAQVHGVLVVPALRRVYATATGANKVVLIDEETGRVLGKTATGAYPDGLAYDPANGTIWITNESGVSVTIIDAATGAPRGTVHLGGDLATSPTTQSRVTCWWTRKAVTSSRSSTRRPARSFAGCRCPAARTTTA